MTNRTKEVMQELGIKTSELAKKLGKTYIGVNQLLNNDVLKADTYESLANAIGVPSWRLFLSDKEIKDIKSQGTTSLICPHCGKPINIELKK